MGTSSSHSGNKDNKGVKYGWNKEFYRVFQ